ncbi:hypothetical protein AYO22_02633 [Fonsecaea multimorphosa]|nr:hypothetical protein AYO22_02633 [Fonsecaea multimorphosa]
MNQRFRFDNQTVVVTAAGNELGQAYARFFASRGANVIAADQVVQDIQRTGGRAVVNHDVVTDGEKIVQSAIDAFGRIDVLINNASLPRDIEFEHIHDVDWDQANATLLKGAFKCTRAAWPYFRKQKYGRVIFSTSTAGLYGSPGQSHSAAMGSALVGFGQTLAGEGAKYNILSNIIDPLIAAPTTGGHLSWNTQSAEIAQSVIPLVAVLAHSTTSENGSVFDVGGGYMAKLRWERSSGLLLQAGDTLTPGALLNKWDKIADFTQAEYPTGPVDMIKKLEDASKLKSNDPGEAIRFDGKVAVVTGGGAGLGRAYCLGLARLGAFVVVNDVREPDTVVNEIRAIGSKAVPNRTSVEDGAAIIETALSAFGRVDIVINNAGILRDKAFANMTEQQWDHVLNVHLQGTYKVTHAAWPHMLKQKYGRIINTTSTSGIYGNFGQTNYASAKAGILGLSRALAREGRKYNVHVNTIAPNAGTQMSRSIFTEEVAQALKTDYVVPLVLLLCSDKTPSPSTGLLFEVGSGWQGRTRWQRAGGQKWSKTHGLDPEQVAERWSKITDFQGQGLESPEDIETGLKPILADAERKNKL